MLIIYAHPNKTGHCGYILKKVKEALEKRNISYLILDLYALNYSPILQPNEHYTSDHCEISPETEEFQKLFKKEQRFIFIYPTWWNNMPAILKGFFDRTMTNRFAYRYTQFFPKGLLRGKALVFTTTGGPALVEKLFLGNRSLKLITRDVLNFCGIQAKGILIGSAGKLDSKKKILIDKIVKKNIEFLN
ncbi:MAG: NAD(P)H-dependent oxidoreductase [Candidatus Moraniibacteriota bacterium]